MKNNKMILAAVCSCLLLLFSHCGLSFAASSGNAGYIVDADEIEYDMASGEGTATGKTTITQGNGTATGLKGATFNSKTRTGRLYGGVEAQRGDEQLRSEELVIYSDRYVSAVGNAVIVKGSRTLAAPRVDYHDDARFAETLGGYARLSDTDGSWLTAGKISYNMQTGLANATGGVKLESVPRNFTGSGDTAVYNTNEAGYIELIGNATATQDGNTVRGDKLRFTNISGKNSRTHAQGNVRIVYYPKNSVTEEKTA